MCCIIWKLRVWLFKPPTPNVLNKLELLLRRQLLSCFSNLFIRLAEFRNMITLSEKTVTDSESVWWIGSQIWQSNSWYQVHDIKVQRPQEFATINAWTVLNVSSPAIGTCKRDYGALGFLLQHFPWILTVIQPDSDPLEVSFSINQRAKKPRTLQVAIEGQGPCLSEISRQVVLLWHACQEHGVSFTSMAP